MNSDYEKNSLSATAMEALIQANGQAVETRQRIPYEMVVYAIPEEWREEEMNLLRQAVQFQPTLYKQIDTLATLADEAKLLKLVNNRSTGSDVDRQKLQEKVRSSLNRLRRLGMVWFMGHDSSKFRITESVFRFGADVRAGDDPREAQRRLIRDGEAMPIENHLQLNDETEENQPDSGEEE